LTMDVILLTVTDRRLIRPLVREGAPHGQDNNRQTGTNILAMSPRGGSTPRLITGRNVTLIVTYESDICA
jgi:hypothetical protein